MKRIHVRQPSGPCKRLFANAIIYNMCRLLHTYVSYVFVGQDYYNLPLQNGSSFLSLYCVLFGLVILPAFLKDILSWIHKYSLNFLFAFYVVVTHLHQETEVCSCDKGKNVYGGYIVLHGEYLPLLYLLWLMTFTCKCSLNKITTRFYGFSAAHVSLLARI